MSDIEVTFQSNGEEIGELFEQACERALVRMGLSAEGFAKKNLTRSKVVDTGLLRNSVTYAVSGQEAAKKDYKARKATKVKDENGKYTKVLKTGKYSGTAPESEDGSKSVYIGTNVEYAPYIELGTSKMAARPYIKPAVTDHSGVYKRILEDEMKNA